MAAVAGTAEPTLPQNAETRPQHIARELVWRFLLPAPAGGSFRQLVLLGGTPALADRIVEWGIAREVLGALPPGRTADAVVRLHRAAEDPARAASCLAPGGVLYAEVRRAHRLERSTAAASIQHALERAGMTGARFYWCKPDLDTRKLFIPLAAPGAVRWYVHSASAATTPRQWLERAVLSRIAGFRRAFALLVDNYAVTAVAAPAPSSGPFLLDDTILPAELRRPGMHALLIAPGSRTVLLPFAPESSAPVAAVKISPAPVRNETTETEQRNLAAVYDLLDDRMRATLPRPYGCTESGGLAVSVEGVVPGRMLWTGHHGGSRRGRDERATADMRRVIDWLIELHRQTEMRRDPWGESLLGRAAADLLDQYERTLLTTAAERALLSDVRRRSAALRSEPIPLVWSHCDLHPNNIYCAGDVISVIDWTAARPGPPIVDLVYFLSKWSASFHHAHNDDAKVRTFQRLFIAPATGDVVIAAAHQEMRRYLDALDIDARFLPLVIALSRIQNAVKLAGKAARYQSVRKRADRDVKYVRALAADLDAFRSHYDIELHTAPAASGRAHG